MTYRLGGVEIPALPGNEALKTEINHFFDCIEQKKPPMTNALHGLRIVHILEAINLSIAQRGRVVELPQAADEAWPGQGRSAAAR
jgi:predicted dehydrogenase